MPIPIAVAKHRASAAATAQSSSGGGVQAASDLRGRKRGRTSQSAATPEAKSKKRQKPSGTSLSRASSSKKLAPGKENQNPPKAKQSNPGMNGATSQKDLPREDVKNEGDASWLLEAMETGRDPRKKSIQQRLNATTKEALNRRNENGYTPLHVACLHKKTLWVTALIENGCDPAARTGSVETEVDGVKCKELGGDTPLHLAVQAGSLECAEALVRTGVDVSVVNDARQSPLDMARVCSLPFTTVKGKQEVLSICTALEDWAKKQRTRANPKPDAPIGWTDRNLPYWIPRGWQYVERKRAGGDLECFYLTPDKKEVFRTERQVERYIDRNPQEQEEVMEEEESEPEPPSMTEKQNAIMEAFEDFKKPKGRLKPKMHIVVFDNVLVASGIVSKVRFTRDGEEFRIRWDKNIRDDIPDRWKIKGLWWIRDQFDVRIAPKNLHDLQNKLKNKDKNSQDSKVSQDSKESRPMGSVDAKE